MNHWRCLLLLVAAAAVIDPSFGQLEGIGGATPAPGTTPVPGTTPQPVAGAVPGSDAPVPTTAPVQAAATTTEPPVLTWSGCIDPVKGDQPIKLGKPTTICIVLASSTDWGGPAVRLLRLSFQPEADEFSSFHVPSSYEDLVAVGSSALLGQDKNITIHVASQQQLSFQRMFYNIDSGRFYPYLTAIIDVSKGRVKGITWDDACLFCGGDRCEENTYDFNGNIGNRDQYRQPTKACYHTQEECDQGKTDELCDVTVHVVWTGDDADGKAFQSSAFRFSAFPPQELKNRLNLPEVPDFGFGGDDATTAEGAETTPDGDQGSA